MLCRGDRNFFFQRVVISRSNPYDILFLQQGEIDKTAAVGSFFLWMFGAALFNDRN